MSGLGYYLTGLGRGGFGQGQDCTTRGCSRWGRAGPELMRTHAVVRLGAAGRVGSSPLHTRPVARELQLLQQSSKPRTCA